MHTVSFPFSKLFCIVFSVLVWSSEECTLSDDSHLHKSTSKFTISSLNLFSVSRGPAFPAQLWAGHWHPDRYVLPQRAQACQQAFSLTQLRSATVCDSTWQINKYSLNRGTYETQHSKLSHVFCAHTHTSLALLFFTSFLLRVEPCPLRNTALEAVHPQHWLHFLGVPPPPSLLLPSFSLHHFSWKGH